MRVLIGEDSELTSELDFSLVATAYGVGDRTLGTLGIFGPSRMEYEKVIPLVHYLGETLSRALAEAFPGSRPETTGDRAGLRNLDEPADSHSGGHLADIGERGRRMAETRSDSGEATELDLDGRSDRISRSAMRDAVAAVEGVEAGAAARQTRRGRRRRRTPATPAEVAKLRREVADLRDRSMRTLADFDNFRKRSERERQEPGATPCSSPCATC